MQRLGLTLAGAICAGALLVWGHGAWAGKRLADPPAGSLPAQTEIRLLSAGRAPRHPIRYRFRAGAQVTWTLEMRTAMSIDLGFGQPLRTVLPASETQVHSRVRAVDARGRATVSFRVTRVGVRPGGGVPPAQRQAFQSAMRGLVGLRGTSLLSPRGVALRSRFQVPPGLSAQTRRLVQAMEQQMRQVTTQLPSEPVGIGARWRVRIPIQGPPVRFVSVLTYRLLARRQNRVRVAVTAGGWAPPQSVSFGGAGSALLRLRRMTTTGSGTLSFALDRPAVTGKMSLRQRLDAKANLGATQRPMQIETRVQVQFR